jgi:hypothetical protein
MPTSVSILAAITNSIRSTLKQEGLQKAREQWTTVNDMLSTEDWWPPVARAVRGEIDAFADELTHQKGEQKTPVSPIYINNTNGFTAKKEFNTTIGQVDQMVAVADSGSSVIHSNTNSITA